VAKVLDGADNVASKIKAENPGMSSREAWDLAHERANMKLQSYRDNIEKQHLLMAKSEKVFGEINDMKFNRRMKQEKASLQLQREEEDQMMKQRFIMKRNMNCGQSMVDEDDDASLGEEASLEGLPGAIPSSVSEQSESPATMPTVEPDAKMPAMEESPAKMEDAQMFLGMMANLSVSEPPAPVLPPSGDPPILPPSGDRPVSQNLLYSDENNGGNETQLSLLVGGEAVSCSHTLTHLKTQLERGESSTFNIYLKRKACSNQ
ncbi:MAG: hypothetical protein SGILL_009504, partial [Bacillariaceae sp.]